MTKYTVFYRNKPVKILEAKIDGNIIHLKDNTRWFKDTKRRVGGYDYHPEWSCLPTVLGDKENLKELKK